jgi:hypothetical protein
MFWIGSALVIGGLLFAGVPWFVLVGGFVVLVGIALAGEG